MKRILIILMLCAGLRAQETAPKTEPFARAQIQQFLREAREAYAAGDPEAQLEAAQRFQALLDQAPEGELNPESLQLAKGMALLKAGKPGEAQQAFEAITGFDDAEERSRLRNLRGQAQMQLAESAVANEQWEEAKKSMEGAVESFTNALRDTPAANHARHNLELSQKRLKEIIEQMPPPQEDQEQDEEDGEQDEEQQEDQGEQDQTDPSDEESDSSDKEESPDEEAPAEPSDESDGSDESDNPQPSEPSDPSPANGEPDEDLDVRQAEQILDAYLEQEKHQRSQILQQRIQSIPVEKDW